jgi:septal ring factor EnvC (AmiA/AmiB activator)
METRLQWLLMLCLIMFPLAGEALDKQALERKQQSLQASQQRHQKLKQDRNALQQELENSRKHLVRIAREIREHEIHLLKLEESQAILQAEVDRVDHDLSLRRREIEKLLQSLLRISRVPPEAVVAMPGNLRKTLQAAEILEKLTAKLRRKSQILKQDLVALEKNKASLQKKHETISQAKISLEKDEQKLGEALEKQQIIFSQLHRKQEEEAKKIATLKAESRNLEQLLQNLKAQEAQSSQRHARLSALPKARPTAPKRPDDWLQRASSALPDAAIKPQNFAKLKGTLSLPIVGRVHKRFGQKLQQNQTHRGLTIRGRRGAQVIAPLAGEVVFTGPFLNYGRMVILQIDKQHHLLMAGLDAIHCKEGQKMLAGEPIGKLVEKNPADLYLELRKQTTPIDPAPWFRS